MKGVSVKRLKAVTASGMTRREVLGLGVGLGLVAACGPLGQGGGSTPSSGPSGPKGTITIAVVTDALTMDPSKDISAASRAVGRNIFDTLTDIKRDGTVGPALAESWASSDAVTWTFKIRDGVKFHNGDPLTVDDVVWTFETIAKDTKSPAATYLKDVSKIEKVGENSVRFVLKSPDAIFAREMYLISIMPRADYLAKGPEKFALAPVGSGPYKFVKWIKDDRLELEAVGSSHFTASPTIKSVVFRPVPSQSSRVAGLESGELDLVALLPPPEVVRLQKVSGLRVQLVESNKNIELGMNAGVKPLDNVKVRQAIDLSIDRAQLTRELLGGLGKPTDQPYAPSVFGFDPKRPLPKYDPDRAKVLLREAGYPDGFEVAFQYPTDRFAFGTEVAQAVAGYLGKVGVRTKQEAMTYSAFFPLWTGKQLKQLFLFALGPVLMDAETGLQNIYRSYGYWSTPEFEALYRKQRATSDEKQRLETLWEITRLAGESYPISWLYTEVAAYGLRDRVEWTPWADDRFDAARMRLKG